MKALVLDATQTRAKQWRIEQLNPLCRPDRIDEIARVMVFLACDDGSHVNGQMLNIDGGPCAGLPVCKGRMAWVRRLLCC